MTQKLTKVGEAIMYMCSVENLDFLHRKRTSADIGPYYSVLECPHQKWCPCAMSVSLLLIIPQLFHFISMPPLRRSYSPLVPGGGIRQNPSHNHPLLSPSSRCFNASTQPNGPWPPYSDGQLIQSFGSGHSCLQSKVRASIISPSQQAKWLYTSAESDVGGR